MNYGSYLSIAGISTAAIESNERIAQVVRCAVSTPQGIVNRY